MGVPIGQTPPDVAAYLQGLEDRIALLENPQNPQRMFSIASTGLTAANAATYANSSVYLTDLNQLAYSNGAHWYKIAVGTQII